ISVRPRVARNSMRSAFLWLRLPGQAVEGPEAEVQAAASVAVAAGEVEVVGVGAADVGEVAPVWRPHRPQRVARQGRAARAAPSTEDDLPSAGEDDRSIGEELEVTSVVGKPLVLSSSKQVRFCEERSTGDVCERLPSSPCDVFDRSAALAAER